MSSVGTATFEAVADFSKVRSEVDRTKASMGELGTAVDGLNGHAGKTAGKWESTATTMKSTGQKMSLGLTVPLTLMGGAALKAFEDFDTAIANVQANTGASAAEMEQVRKKAMDMGKATQFSAADAATSMFNLTAAGMDVNEAMGAIDGTMLLASASGVSLEEATDLVAKSMNAFGLEAGDAAHVSDVFTQAANQSAATVQDLQYGMAHAGQLGAKYGQSIEAVTASIETLVNQGVPAASAGVGIRQAMDSLAAPTDKAAKVMDDLGINVRDAQGNMLPLPEIVARVEKGFSGLSAAQRDQAAKAMFGVEGGKAMVLMMNSQYKASQNTAQGADALAKITAVMGEEWVKARTKNGEFNATGADAVKVLTLLNEKSDGTAKAFDKIKAETTARKIEQLKGSFETLATSLIGAVAPGLETVLKVVQFFVDGFTKLSEWSPVVGQVVVGLGVLLAVMGPLMIMVSSLITAFTTIRTAMMGLQVASMLSGVLSGLGTAISAVATAFRVATMAMISNPIVLVVMAIIAVIALLIWKWDTVKQWLITAWEAIKVAAVATWGAIKVALETAWNWIVAVAQAIWDGLKWYFQTLVAFWTTVFTTAWNVITTVLTTAWNWIVAVAQAIWNGLQLYFQTMLTFWQTVFSLAWTGIQTVLTTIWDAIKTVATVVWDAIKLMFTVWLTTVKTAFTTAWNAIKVIVETVWNALKAAASVVWGGIKAVIETVIGTIRSVISGGLSFVKGLWQATFGAFASIVTGAFHTVKSAVESVVSWLSGKFAAVKGFVDGIKNAVSSVTSFGGKVLGALGFAGGGIVPGSGTGDKVPAMLTPGEGILPREVMQRLGTRQFEALRSGNWTDLSSVAAPQVSSVAQTTENRSWNVTVVNPVPERASESLPRVVRKLAGV